MSWLQLCHILSVKRLVLDFTPDVPMVLIACLDLAVRIVEQMEVIGEIDILPYLQDVGSAALSSLGLFLYDASSQARSWPTMMAILMTDIVFLANDIESARTLGPITQASTQTHAALRRRKSGSGRSLRSTLCTASLDEVERAEPGCHSSP